MTMSAADMSLERAGASRVLAWDGPTRLFKWTFVALVVDGWISNTFGASVPAWHKWNGYLILVLLVFRLFWGLVGGSTARFSFIAGPKRALAYIAAIRHGRPLHYLGHNPLGGWMVVGLLVLVAAQALTGLYAADEDRLIIEGPLAATTSDAAVAFASRWHHLVFKLIEAAALLHICANLFYSFVKRDPLIPAMIHGGKPAAAYVDQKAAQPGSWTRAAFCLIAAAVVVFGGILAAGGKIF